MQAVSGSTKLTFVEGGSSNENKAFIAVAYICVSPGASN